MRRSPSLVVALLLAAPAAAEETPRLEPGSPRAVEEAMRLYRTANDVWGAGRRSHAGRLAARAVGLAPGAPGPRRLLGHLLHEQGDCSLALHHLREFVRLGRVEKQVKQARKLIKDCTTSGKRKGKLAVRVVPPAAEVRVLTPGEDKPVASGNGSVEAELPAGSWRVEARLAGRVDGSFPVQVPAGLRTAVSYSLALRPAVLTVVSVPPGALVKVDGDPAGRAPLQLDPLPPGDHELVATLPGHEPARARVSAEPGQAVRAELRPAPKPARLRVLAGVEGAAVGIDDGAGCRAPCEVEVPANRPQRLRLRAPGYLDATREVVAGPDRIGELRVRLEPETALLERRGRARGGMVLAGTGAALLAGGAWALLAALGAADDADGAFERYRGAGTGREADAAWREAAALDGLAETQTALAAGLLAVGAAAGLWGTWRWLGTPDEEAALEQGGDDAQ